MSRVRERKAYPVRWRRAAAPFATSAVGEFAREVVILGRSKERSDAAQTLGSMPFPASAAAAQNSDPPHSSATVTAWILGSSPRMTNGGRLSTITTLAPLLPSPISIRLASSNRSPTPYE
ncbi:hypothetical protein EN827_24500 [Mesorhizobium sp. M1D.F.Ca.ET.184.01.1.1]|nr:hypothetical protein EN874_026125 [Mesorhizobium sp. M1D.F.Ca.ET.231.01.1.1]TGP27738.1 hypothetical protein EN877_25415 [Mesorhizobium sp. M1D.F.Ca.ET.234.01.1.1]TGS42088.1 hypothetical protein EN827_24500 [Mesorhizobium sp. M1D.F.Ca.ET.184.01.1.1]TGS59440.1 hypothetical protein EN826_024500 [Mesorhizobium sp. M1D.F.Ca.ET.183.01.1.1]